MRCRPGSTPHNTRCVPPADGKTPKGDRAASYVVGVLKLADEICPESAPRQACVNNILAVFWTILGGCCKVFSSLLS